jgi:adenine-specific DNA glycosylase
MTQDRLEFGIAALRKLGVIRHALTHRRYEFQAWTAEYKDTPAPGQVWVTLAELDAYPLPKPHVRIAELLANPE